jgi:hypothetical protein
MATIDRRGVGGSKKSAPRSMMPTFLFVLVACGVAYYVWTQPVGLELKRAIQVVTGPVQQIINDLLTVE